jgi:hypothetical protein
LRQQPKNKVRRSGAAVEKAWLANPLDRPYVSAADGCESGFAAFGHPATA